MRATAFDGLMHRLPPRKRRDMEADFEEAIFGRSFPGSRLAALLRLRSYRRLRKKAVRAAGVG
jgi:hypothetical protein